METSFNVDSDKQMKSFKGPTSKECMKRVAKGENGRNDQCSDGCAREAD